MRKGGWTTLVLMAVAAGCAAGDGCACMTQIPGGFPAEERRANEVQARVSQSGLQFFSDRFAQIKDQLFPDGLVFPVPPKCGADPRVCCYVPYGYCRMLFDLDRRAQDPPRFQLQPHGDNRALLTLRARVRTAVPMPVHQRGLFGDISCNLSVNSAWAGDPSITIQADLVLGDDPLTGETRVSIAQTWVSGLTAGDVNISGGLLCGFASNADAATQIMTQFRQELPAALSEMLCAECAGNDDCAPQGTCAGGVCEIGSGASRRCMQRFGTSGRLGAAALFGALPTAGADALDLYLTAGGFARSSGGGLSLGVRTGALPAGDVAAHACVPAAPQPPAAEIAESTALRENRHPVTNEPFDIGRGSHRAFLDRAAWAAHQAGFLCLNVGTRQVPLLSTSALGILAPSLADLVFGDDAPMFLLIRPQRPPALALGAGTFADGPGGGRDIDEPLVTVSLPELEVDLYALVDDRYVRVLTLIADLTVPLGLDVDGADRVIPVLGDLADAFDRITVENSGLLAEAPADIAARFPAVLAVALPSLADGLSAFEVPAMAGFTLELGPDSIVALEDQTMIGIFGDLAVASAARALTATTSAEVLAVRPEAGELDLWLGGVSATGAPLEWQVRLDGGFWSPYGPASRLTLRRAALALQGRHRLEVRAREIGAPRSADPAPVVIEVVVDTVAPRVRAAVRDDGWLIDASDHVSPREALRVRYRADDGAWIEARAPLPLFLPATTARRHLEVEVTDEAGNQARWTAPVVGFHGTAGSGGCDCRASLGGGDAGGLIVLIGACVLALRPRRRRRGALRCGLFGAALLLTPGCKGQVGGDDGGQDPGPTAVTPGPTGRWASMASDGDRVVIAAYERTYGDLVIAEIRAPGEPTFTVVDGAPEGPVVLDPAGYRGGVTAPGPDVGAWTSTALLDGRASVAYQDRDLGALRLALEAAAGDWRSHEVDPGGDGAAGAHASLSVGPGGLVGIAYVWTATEAPPDEVDEGDGGDEGDGPGARLVVQLRWAQATTATPQSPDDWLIEVIDEAVIEADLEHEPEFSDVGLGTGLFASAARLSDGTPVVAYYRQVTGDLILARRADEGWHLWDLDASPLSDRGQWASVAVDAGDVVHVAYQDAHPDRLLLASWDGESVTREVIDDGRREGDRPHSVGAAARLLHDAAGRLAVVYQDATLSDLLWARRDGDGVWQRGALLSGEVGYGFFTAAALAGDTVWVSTYAYDQAFWPPGETVVTTLP